MTPWFQRARSRVLVFLHDLLMIPLAWGLTYWVRFNLAYIPPEFSRRSSSARRWIFCPW